MTSPLPDAAGLGDTGHVADHNLIVAAIASKAEQSTVDSLTTTVAGKLDATSATATYEPIGAQAAAEATAASALSEHAADTTAVHGIADTGALVASSAYDLIVQVTQAAYDAIGTKDARTLYVIVG